MPIEIIVPRLGWSMEEGAFVAWLKKDGEFVRAGEALFSIEGDKAIQEIESIDSGVLRIAPNSPKQGDAIRVGDVIGNLLSAAETGTQPGKSNSGSSGAKPTLTLASASETGGAPPIRQSIEPAQEVTLPTATTENVQPTRAPAISPRALRVANELGLDWTTIIGTGRTGRIRERDVRAAARSGVAARTFTAPSLAATTNERGASVLVTGGCGFIGTWVLRELIARGARPIVLDVAARPERWKRVLGDASEQVALVQGSLLNRELLAHLFEEHRISHMIHLAALLTPACQVDPWEGCNANVLGSIALFEQARRVRGQIKGFSYGSSVAVFGDESDQASDSNGPPTFYGAFKKVVEILAEQYWRHFEVASLGIRPQVAYGPEREAGLTAGPSLAARAAARGEAFCISYTGRVGYDYVEDVARAFVRGALETPPGAQVVDLAGEMADVNAIISAIAATLPDAVARLSASGPVVPANAPPSPRFISTLFPDWKTTSLLEGMRRTVEFYQAGRTAKIATS